VDQDIRQILDRWPYKPGEINVRRVIGNDNKVKIQMRLNLGLLQMEPTGRPDGQRPFGKESLLDYYEGKLNDYVLRHDTDKGFTVGAQGCAELSEEGLQYYRRYLGNFFLKEYAAVIRDTERNIRLLDFMRKYARHEADRDALEGYRPYTLMMNVQAKAHLALEEGDLDQALAEVNAGLQKVRSFFTDQGQHELLRKSTEVQTLTDLRDQLLSQKPRSRLEVLRERMHHAVEAEQYERAARLRDQIDELERSDEESRRSPSGSS